MQVLNLAGNDAILFSAKSNSTGDADDDDDDDSVPMEMLMPDESLLPDVEKDRLTDDNLSEDDFKLHPVQKVARDQQKAAAPAVVAVAKKSSAVILTSDEEEEDGDEESLAKGLNFDDFSDVDASQQPLVASYHSHRGGGGGGSSSSISRGSRGAGGAPKELTGLMTDFVSNMIPWNKVGNLIAAAGGDHQMSRSESSAVQAHSKKRRPTKKEPSVESSDDDDDSEFELLNTDELKSYET